MVRKGLTGIALSLLLGGNAGAQEIELPGTDLPTVQLPFVEQTVWPGESWETTSLPASAEAEITSLIDGVMGRSLEDEMGETRSVVVIHEGRLVAEAYRDGFDAETKQVSWSMAKSITHALVGRALQEGVIDTVDAPMPGPWDPDDPRAAITWRQWLTMTDGLAYNEIGEADLTKNDVVQMMFGDGRLDVVSYVAGLLVAYEPGTVWNYSTAGFHTIAQALQSSLGFGREDTDNWIQGNLFGPIGMDAVAEFDAAGTFLGGSLAYASARDFARFGYLYLRDGEWDGEQLLPEGWVDFARTKSPAENVNVYGAGWWITPPEGVERSHTQAALTCPCDAFHAGGNEGQTIWIVPSKDLVIVRLGLMPNSPENWRALYEWNQEVARAFQDVE
ncbi:MAG: serine hydrolase [Pseudomonadota bacterium]